MKKILIGTYTNFPIYVEVPDWFEPEDEKIMHDFFNELGKPRVEVDPVLAKYCRMKTKTFLDGGKYNA